MRQMSSEANLQSVTAIPEIAGDQQALVDLIYESALDPELWEDFVEELSELCHGAAVAMALNFEDQSRGMVVRSGFVETEAELRERRQDLTSPFDDPQPIHDQGFAFLGDLFPTEEVRASEHYQTLLAPSDLEPEPPLVHVLGRTNGQPTSAIGVYRRVNGPPLSADVQANCNELVPHLARAFRVQVELHKVRERRLALSEAIDRFPTGVIVVDALQRRVLANQCAEETLVLRDGLWLENERVATSSPDDDRKLQEAIAEAVAEAARGEAAGESHIVALRRPSGEAPLQIMIAPLSDVPAGADDHHPIAALFVPEPGAAHVETNVLQKLYSLTAAEAAFIAAFVAERNLEAAATARGIRTSTARGYLKTAFQKTGTNTQHGLMHLLLTGVSRIRRP